MVEAGDKAGNNGAAAEDAGLAPVFGALGESFGLSRPASLCFAAIWRAAQAPCADDLVASAGISRSNVSTALKELRSIGLIAVARTPGDRREYFTAPADPWVIVRQLIAERQRRSLAPALDRLTALDHADPRLEALVATLEAVSDWLGRLARMEPTELAAHIGNGEDGKKKKKKAKK